MKKDDERIKKLKQLYSMVSALSDDEQIVVANALPSDVLLTCIANRFNSLESRVARVEAALILTGLGSKED